MPSTARGPLGVVGVEACLHATPTSYALCLSGQAAVWLMPPKRTWRRLRAGPGSRWAPRGRKVHSSTVFRFNCTWCERTGGKCFHGTGTDFHDMLA